MNEFPLLSTSDENCVLIDNLPIVPQQKFERLKAALRRVLAIHGVVKELELLTNDCQSQTLGQAFVEFESKEAVILCLSTGVKLDSNTPLRVNPLSDFAKYANIPDICPCLPRTVHQSLANDRSWLIDGRDQFAIRCGNETKIYWHDSTSQDFARELVYDGERERVNGKIWTDKSITWSPQGTYFVTFHDQGCAFWAGEQFEKVGKVTHTGASLICFDNNEKYCYTMDSRRNAKVWRVSDCVMLREFQGVNKLSWNFDGSWLVVLRDEIKISVYELPLVTLLDKKSLIVPELSDVSWHPTKNVIFYASCDDHGNAGQLSLIEIPSKKILRKKNMCSIETFTSYWQSDGRFLCVHARNSSHEYLMFFELMEKDVPVEVMKLTHRLSNFQWEPHTNRFAIALIVAGTKMDIQVFEKSKKCDPVYTYHKRQVSELCWSPSGDFLVFVFMEKGATVLEFVCLSCTDFNVVKKHDNCNFVEWDPSGRYLLSAALQPFGSDEDELWNAGYRIWLPNGEMIVNSRTPLSYQICWRSRPKTILGEARQKQLALMSIQDEYFQQFADADERIRKAKMTSIEQERSQLKAEWKAYRKQCNLLVKSQVDALWRIRYVKHPDSINSNEL
jgi:translation initiation factor 3 subunit B